MLRYFVSYHATSMDGQAVFGNAEVGRVSEISSIKEIRSISDDIMKKEQFAKPPAILNWRLFE